MKRYQAFTLRISLTEVRPPFWRRFRVPSDITLHELHRLSEIVMGWGAEEPHTFIDRAGNRYTTPPFAPGTKDDRRTKLRAVLSRPGDHLTYHFGFAEDWSHEIVLEKAAHSNQLVGVRCLDGRRRCPPTDCGGPLGFEELLMSLRCRQGARPAVNRRGSIKPPFRPLDFKVSAVNAALRRLKL
jgi:hypothetical protein